MTWPHGDPAAVVGRVLANPAYARAPATVRGNPLQSLFALALRWLVDHVLRPLFHPFARALAASHGLSSAIGAGVIVVTLGVLAFAVFRLVLALAATTRRASLQPEDARPLAPERSAAASRVAARAAAARGDFGAAIANLFAAALAALDARGLVPFDPARTPGEYRRLVRRARREAAPAFDELSERYVRAAFAARAAAGGDFEAAERALDALEPDLA